MKRLRLLPAFVCLLVLVVALAPTARAQNVQAFTLPSFTADYYLDRNSASTSTLHTVEVITAQFPDIDQNHGILRAIPETYQGHTVSLNIDSVTNETGAALQYTTSESNDNLVLKIGDPNVYVHGLVTYKITYDQKNVVSITPDQQQFFWDVNGDQWQQTIGTTVARVHIPAGLVSSLQDKRLCYAGYSGSTDQTSCQISPPVDENGGKLITATTQNLMPEQTLSFAIGFRAGTFQLGPEIAQAKRAQQIKIAEYAALIVIPPVLVGSFLINMWRKYGKDPKGRGVIIPEYQPPKGLNALTSDFIRIEDVENIAITALVIELAVRQYLNIYEVKTARHLLPDSTSYSLKLVKDPSDLTVEEQKVLDMFFDGVNIVGTEIDFQALKSNEQRQRLFTACKSLKKDLGKSLLAAGYFRNDPTTAGRAYYIAGMAMLFVSFFIYRVSLPAAISLGLTAVIAMFVGGNMPSRSAAGVQVHDQLLGLKQYMKYAEEDRIKFLQSPEGAEKIQEAGLSPNDPKFRLKLFESLLPYAIILGLEKDWAKQFVDVYVAPPSWYGGNMSTFNSVYLASSLNSFISANNVVFAAPSGSGGGGFGGGGAGGGGGGGGGGGW
ncbi:MAG TPA: DUF2207 domain-containing protein [Candidatus Binatia bacterium]|nr:DUF2207 domain-containing protein [Candidatus Binatia bacterium]